MSRENDFYTSFVQACQLKKGDIVDVASDMWQFIICFHNRKETFDPNRLIDALQQAVGEEGTVLIRTFNWDFCHDTPFDRRNTPSQTGSLGNVALKRPDFVRTKHALYSWCVWGREQAYLTEIDPVDSFGNDSIFAWLEEKGAIYLKLGKTKAFPLTIIHLEEERCGIPFRFIKAFTGGYIDYDGSITEKTYTMYVRNLDYVMELRPENIKNIFRTEHITTETSYEGIPIVYGRLDVMGEKMYRDIKAGRWSDYWDCKPLSNE